MMTTLWAGLSLGAIYVIVAVGYNIVYVASRVFNFAQAQFVMVGALVALVAGNSAGLPLWLTLVLCVVIGGVVGGLEELGAVRWLRGLGAHNELVTTLGVATLLSGIALVLFGSEAKRLDYFSEQQPLDLLGGRVLLTEVLLIVVALVLAVVVGVLTRRTMIGLASLATSEDHEAGALRGINAGRLATGAFVLAGALVAVTGPLIAAKTFAIYNVGDLLAVKAFVALAIGGFGSYTGAAVGGFAVGVIEVFAARYLGSEWQNTTVFILLLVVLLVIPRGIFGRRTGRAV